jgi:hypothetical protein
MHGIFHCGIADFSFNSQFFNFADGIGEKLNNLTSIPGIISISAIFMKQSPVGK